MSKQDDAAAEPVQIAKHSTMFLKVDDLNVDPETQRPLDEAAARNIADNFDADAFGVPHVCKRGGKFYIVDGQHRVHALRLMGWNGQKIECVLHGEMSKRDSASLFLSLNNQRAVTYLNKFLCRITAKEEIACAIRDVVSSCNLIVDRFSRDGSITAAKALEDVYLGRGIKIRGQNPLALKGTLTAATEAWGKTTHAVDGHVIRGIGMLLLRYGENVNLDRLIEKLKSIHGGPGGLIGRGQGKRELHGGTLPAGIAHYLADEYNRGLGGTAKARLSPWKSDVVEASEIAP